MEKNQLDLSKDVVDLHNIIQDAVSHVALIVRDREGHVEENLGAKQSEILASKFHMTNVITNMLDNAIKYTQTGGDVKVRLARSNGQALVSVIDNGPGIKQKDLPRVFEKFYRARSELDDIPGTGLGLAIVKTIAEHHRGQVWVESAPDTGSIFTLVLPTAK